MALKSTFEKYIPLFVPYMEACSDKFCTLFTQVNDKDSPLFCESVVYTVAGLVGLPEIINSWPTSSIKCLVELSDDDPQNRMMLQRLNVLYKLYNNCLIIFEDINSAGTSETHTFAYIKCGSDTYYIPSSQSDKANVEIDLSFEKLIEKIFDLALERNYEIAYEKYIDLFRYQPTKYDGSNMFALDLRYDKEIVNSFKIFFNPIEPFHNNLLLKYVNYLSDTWIDCWKYESLSDKEKEQIKHKINQLKGKVII